MAAAIAFACSGHIIRFVGTAGDPTWHWVGAVVLAVLAGAAVLSFVRAVLAIRAFEEENGKDDGRQKPVNRR
ncbi:hypothetical protein AB6V29_05565 [Microbacterium sp. 20-116]|uniref:hypothetical protein n=1 Tax=Microbacterium sp. 20-116 TaxID=3239883 RepID=UPI0034E241A8